MCERCDALFKNLAQTVVTSYNEQCLLTKPEDAVSLDGLDATQIRFVGNLVIAMIAARHGTRKALELVCGAGAVLSHVRKVQHQAATS